MERQSLPMAHWLSRWTQGTNSKRHDGAQTDRGIKESDPGHAETQQPAPPIHGTKVTDLRRTEPSPHCTAAAGHNNPIARPPSGQEWRFSFRTQCLQFAGDRRSSRRGGQEIDSIHKSILY